MQTSYSYVIIKDNNPYMAQESVLLHNKYSAKKKYAFINKLVHKDGSESIAFIDYSNDLSDLQNKATQYPSWYNYPAGLSKSMQGYISQL